MQPSLDLVRFNYTIFVEIHQEKIRQNSYRNIDNFDLSFIIVMVD